MENNNVKDFIIEFFKDAKIDEDKGVLTISEVHKDFEDFIGKKSPYKLVFDFDLHNKHKDSELIMQGSYFLLAIKDYLSDKGLTSLQKININPELSKIRKLGKFKDSDIKQSGFEYLSEMTFMSVYQYLNEKKQSTNKFLFKGRETIDLDIKNLKVQEGNKEEISIIDLNETYKLAKNKLNFCTNREIKNIKPILKEKLDKELERVKEHYHKQIKEKDEELDRCLEKIVGLKNKLKHTYYERDIRILNRLIKESMERLEKLKQKSYRERLRAEEEFHTNDVIEKHVLSIKNKLINTTIYYYPIYEITTTSKEKTKKIMYNPLFDEEKKDH